MMYTTTTHLAKNVDKKELKKALIVTPGSAVGTTWLNVAKGYSLAVASGWMAVRGNRRRRGAGDRGFTHLSDAWEYSHLLTVVTRARLSRATYRDRIWQRAGR